MVTAILLAAAGCGSSTSTTVSPSGTRCAVSLGGATSVAASGGTGTLTVSAARECPWTASTDAPWLSITSTPSGQGDGAIQYSAASNPSPSIRRGNLIVGETRSELTQAAAPCQFSVSPPSFTFDSAGGDGAVTVNTLEGCRWSGSSSVPWVSVTGTQNPNGSGSLTFHVEANTGEPRTAIFTVAGLPVQVSQGTASAPCTYALDPRSAALDAGGGTTRFTVAARAGCGWTAVSQAPWISISSDPVGAGNGSVTLAIAPNTGGERSGIVTIQNQGFTVTQAGAAAPCTYNVAPTTVSPAAGGGPVNVTVTTSSNCTWTAASQAMWIVVSSGSTGSGNGTVGLTIAANSGAARSGTVSIAGRTVTVNQAAAAPSCSYSIAPTSFAAPASSATSAVDVTSQSGCAWTATSQASWITVTAGATGTGNGRVDLSIAPNSGAARSGSVTIAGQTYTVNQAAVSTACSYTIAPTTFGAPNTETTTGVDVTTQSGCAWTAVSRDAWITITRNASATGNARVDLTIAANSGAARTGTATIAGQTYTVNQAAAPTPCSYSINPTSFAPPDTGGTIMVDVATQSGCAWTSTSQAPWITVTMDTTGNGNGRVEVTAAANTGPARTGTATIAGQTFTVNQAAVPAPCTYSIAPTTFAAPDTAGTSTVDVTAQRGNCSWTAVSQVPWITVTAGASGSGNGRVDVAIAANPGAARSGTVIIAGQTYTVNQAPNPASCSFTLTPPSVDASAAGGPAAVDVATQTGCTWTAVSQAAWITVSTGGSGNGSGRVELAIAANAGPARVGTVTIGTQTFTVNQQGTSVNEAR